MRLFITTLLAVGALALSASTAGAVAINLLAHPSNPAPSAVVTSDAVQVLLALDTQGSTGVQSIFVSVQATGPITFQPGSSGSPAGILPGTPTIFGSAPTIGRVSQPFVLGSDPAGMVRAASFSSASPSGGSSANTIMSLLTFHADSASGIASADVALLFQGGDQVVDAGVDITSSVALGGPVNLITPEPTTALLVGLGLVGLGVAGRRKE